MQPNRPLPLAGTGDLLDAALRLYRAHFVRWLAIAALPALAYAALWYTAALLVHADPPIGDVAIWLRVPILRAANQLHDIATFTSLPQLAFPSWLGLLDLAVLQPLAAGALIAAIDAAARTGQPLSIGAAYRASLPRAGSLVNAALPLLAIRAVLIILFGVAGVGALLLASALYDGADSWIVALVAALGIGLPVLLCGLTLRLYARLVLAPTIIMAEQANPLAAYARSRALTRRKRLAVLAAIVPIGLLAQAIIDLPIYLLYHVPGALRTTAWPWWMRLSSLATPASPLLDAGLVLAYGLTLIVTLSLKSCVGYMLYQALCGTAADDAQDSD
jgi:hypothetical protein